MAAQGEGRVLGCVPALRQAEPGRPWEAGGAAGAGQRPEAAVAGGGCGAEFLPPSRQVPICGASADVRAAEMTDNTHAVSLPFKNDRLKQASQSSKIVFGNS